MLAVKTLYLAMDNYFSCRTVRKGTRGGGSVLHICCYTRIQAQSGMMDVRLLTKIETEAYRNSIHHSGECKFCSGLIQEPSI